MKWGQQVSWCVLWDSRHEQHLMFDGPKPLAFKTKKQCKKFIDEKWGYIKNRPDLKTAPYYWRLPKPVRIRIEYNQIK